MNSERGVRFIYIFKSKYSVMKRNVIPGLFVMLLTTYSCQNGEAAAPEKEKEKSRLEKAEWLLGRWENNSDQGNMSETWVKDGKDAYSAETFIVVGTDTVFKEHSHLEETGKTLQCVISIPGENNDKPVVFTMTKQTDDMMLFENPKHDFPTAIRYEQKGDSVIAEISGTQKGKPAKERFAMVRVK